MAIIITPKQSMRARSLLKWNIHDLANRLNIMIHRLTMFEKGGLRLTASENEEVYKVYKEHGIIFKDNMEVILDSTFDTSGGDNDRKHVAQADLNNQSTPDADDAKATEAYEAAKREQERQEAERKRREAERKRN